MKRTLSANASALTLALLAAATAQAQDLAPTSDETVYFRGWQYKTDIVQDNVDRYNNELGGNVDYATVTGDYPAIMETNLIAGAELDILYANPSQAARYYDGGWVMTAESCPTSTPSRPTCTPTSSRPGPTRASSRGSPTSSAPAA